MRGMRGKTKKVDNETAPTAGAPTVPATGAATSGATPTAAEASRSSFAGGEPGKEVAGFTWPALAAEVPPSVSKQVAIIGTGLTLALSLVSQGIAVALIDPRPSFE
ncbi:unnamed protein product, partial [Symbiodinium sp. CCMP2592]